MAAKKLPAKKQPTPPGKKKPVEVSNKTRMTVTSNLPSVGIANRRDMGPELTAPQMYSRESYTPGMSGGGRTSVRNINSTPIDPKYIWVKARDAAAKKVAAKKAAPKKKK